MQKIFMLPLLTVMLSSTLFTGCSKDEKSRDEHLDEIKGKHIERYTEFDLTGSVRTMREIQSDYLWNDQTQSIDWDEKELYVYTYEFDKTGFILSETDVWNLNEDGIYEFKTESVYRRDTINRLIEWFETQYRWIDGEYVPSSFEKAVYTYDDTEKTVTIIEYQSRDAEDWQVSGTKYVYKQNKYGFIDEYNSERFRRIVSRKRSDDFETTPYLRNVRINDSHGNALESYTINFKSDGSVRLGNVYKAEYTYW